MLNTSEKIKYLEEFRDRNKFSESAWLERGLGYSEPHICEAMHIGFRETADLLISAVEKNASARKMKSILLSSMRQCKRLELDTEEREYAVDLYFELSVIVGVNIKHQLNIFLYGYFIIGLLYIFRLVKGNRKVKTIRQQCSNCDTVFVFGLDEKTLRPANTWLVVQCTTCREFHLAAHQESAQRVSFSNCMPVEMLSKDEYDEEQAKTRLEQIRYFRK